MNDETQTGRRVNTQDRRTENRWQLDRHIPVALIVTVIVQTGALVWYARGLDIAVAQHEKELSQQGLRLQALEGERIGRAVAESRLIAIENELRNMRVAIERLQEQRK
jgi:hypothetical protein